MNSGDANNSLNNPPSNNNKLTVDLHHIKKLSPWVFGWNSTLENLGNLNDVKMKSDWLNGAEKLSNASSVLK